MTLHPGARLGPYEITGSLGSGGMGEVYRANDSRLRREVAIKISGESFSDRFEREARAIAALNHPNICTLHDVGPDFLVMELVEGPTLAERLSDGPIPLDEALDIALQIAHALEAAHEKGIVHRDLKPANIKIRDDGTVKVLDFGLAKAFGSDGAGPSAAMALDNSPTVLGPAISAGVTGLGAIVGTSAYMAPEQAKGTAVDKRADIWAFGVVLWEMITGRRLFAGDSISETLAGVLTSEPDLTAIPPNVRRLLRSCLEKDPRRRLHDISDARLLLDSAPALETPPAPAKRRWVPWATAALMTAALAGTNAFWLTRPAPERRTSRFSLTAPSGTQFAVPMNAAVSPDGRHVVFAAVSQSGRSLWLQSLESATARPLPFGEDANWPSWSPDSRSLVFVNGGYGQIKRADISGGAPQSLCDPVANAPTGAMAWSRDGAILMASTTGLYRLPDSGGVPQRLSEPDASREETAFAFPQFLEDGKRFIFHIQSPNPNTEGVYLGSLDRPEQRHRILASRDKGIYVAPRDGRPAYLMFLRDQTLVVQRFNVDAGILEGDPLHVADNLPTSPSMREGFWLSESGLLVFGTGGLGVKRRLLWIARDGKREEAVPEGLYQSLRLSPDGKEVALDAAAAVEDIWRLEFARGVKTKVTSNPRRDVVPAWSPDGRQLAYMSNRTGTFQLYRRDASGDGTEELLTEGPYPKYLSDWTRDGRFLVYYEITAKTKNDLWALPLSGDRRPVPLRATAATEQHGVVSPDSKWLAYGSDQSGREEVYIQPFPSGSAWPVTSEGGNRPKWRSDGKELFFLNSFRNTIMSASVRITAAGVETSKPVPIVTLSSPLPALMSPYDVSPDGQRLLVLDPVDPTLALSPLVVVMNWDAGVKQ